MASTNAAAVGIGTSGAGSALQVLDRAFAVLKLFNGERQEWTMTAVAAELDLPLSTTHRILGVLLHHGFLARDTASKRFRLGVTAMGLGARSRATIDSVYLEALRALVDAIDETAMVCTVDATAEMSLCVGRIESSQPLRLSVQPGLMLPLHAGAMGKALLAFLPQSQIERVLTQPLARLHTNTITHAPKLRVELRAIQARGYATSFEETNAGLWGVAVPILDQDGRAYASVGTAGPLARFASDYLARQVAACQLAASMIATALGLDVWSGTRASA